MKRWLRTALILLAHMAILGSLGTKLVYDRATRPRVWIQTAYYDPELPIRGRYIALQAVVDLQDAKPTADYTYFTSRLEVRNGKLVAISDPQGSVEVFSRPRAAEGRSTPESSTYVVSEPMLVFIPEHASVPMLREHGKELWVEATVPKKGPPRPIRMGIKDNGVIAPIDLR